MIMILTLRNNKIAHFCVVLTLLPFDKGNIIYTAMLNMCVHVSNIEVLKLSLRICVGLLI